MPGSTNKLKSTRMKLKIGAKMVKRPARATEVTRTNEELDSN